MSAYDNPDALLRFRDGLEALCAEHGVSLLMTADLGLWKEGVWVAYLHDKGDGDTFDLLTTCAYCDGHGDIDNITCPRCNGTGSKELTA